MFSDNPSKIPVIVGPTGVGKTAYAVSVATQLNAELISADSRQIYIGMDIATGKESSMGEWQLVNGRRTLLIEGVPIHGLDVVSPDQQFSVSDWHTLAISIIHEVKNRGNLPLLVGGTGFYLTALAGDIATLHIPPNPILRAELEQLSSPELLDRLAGISGGSDMPVDVHNSRKLIRAIEIAQYQQTQDGKKNEATPLHPHYPLALYGLTMERAKLYDKVDRRIDAMVNEGLIDETKKLLEHYDPSLPSMSGIGYAEIADFLSGRLTKAEAIQKMKWRVHSYIRRQYTWFKKQEVEWFDVNTNGWQQELNDRITQHLYA